MFVLKRSFVVISVVIISTLLLAACGGDQPPATETPVPVEPTGTEEPAATETPVPVEPTETEEPAATETPVPVEPTETEEPAATETPVPVEPTETEEPANVEPEVGTETEVDTEPVAEVEEVSDSSIRTFVIVPEVSTASYSVSEEFFGGALGRLGIESGLVDTVGSTQEVSGEMQLNLGDLAKPVIAGNFVVDVSTLTNDQSRRDNHIRTNALQSFRFPLAEFIITSLESAPSEIADGQEVTFGANGDITIRNITQQITFNLTATLAGDTITGQATTQLKMTDFGFDPPNFVGVLSVEDEFRVNVDFTFVEQ